MTKDNVKRTGAVVVLIIAIAGIINFTSKTKSDAYNSHSSTLTINNQMFIVELADTADERARGLSGRPNLEQGHGMLFIFDEPGFYSFWMKDMNFPIDILWLDENYQVVDSWLDASPSSYPKSVTPKTKAKYVLEVLDWRQ